MTKPPVVTTPLKRRTRSASNLSFVQFPNTPTTGSSQSGLESEEGGHGDSHVHGWQQQGRKQPPRPTPSRYGLRARKDSLQHQHQHSPSRRIKRDIITTPNASFTTPVANTSFSNSNRGLPSMSSSAGKWREEQILIICPGSRTTMAQLGCSELTPPTHRIPTRMFKDGDEWRPYYTYKRTKMVDDVELEEWVEDIDSDEGAVFPIQGGRIVQMDAFLAFLDHVHSLLTTTYHNTPIMLMASPQWTRPNCEIIAQYIFEKTRTPALCLIHSAIATQYGLKNPNMTVIDIGFEKVDVTAIHEGRVVNHLDLGAPTPDRHISGGEVFTQRLLKLLEGKQFSHEMAEQLKRSAICEVLPYASSEETLAELPTENTAGSNAIPAPEAVIEAAQEALKPAELNGEDGEIEETAEDDGVLDVAKIVVSGQTQEFLAKKEKEKGKPGRGRPKAQVEDPAVRIARLPNSKRTHNTFLFEEIVQEEVPKEQPVTNGTGENSILVPEGAPPVEGAEATKPPNSESTETSKPESTDAPNSDSIEASKPESTDAPKSDSAEALKPESTDAPKTDSTEAPKPEATESAAEAKPDASNQTETEHRPKRVRRNIEVGPERFTFADRDEIDRIVTTIYRTIQGIDEIGTRPQCWDNLVFVGNGARLRGLKENILQTLSARHLISPSTATIFTSELPSNLATPSGTGSQTPTGSFNGAPIPSGVNPLLQAATTASSLQIPGATPQAGSETGGSSHRSHHQTPTSIKTVTLPTYLQEWSKNGFEESMFLGAQVAARIVFCVHSNMDVQSVEAQRLASFSRVDYNEYGPKGIRTHSMLS